MEGVPPPHTSWVIKEQRVLPEGTARGGTGGAQWSNGGFGM